jgi:hypothetical protein
MREHPFHPTAPIPPLRRWVHRARTQVPLLRRLTLTLYLPLTLLYAALALQNAVPIALLLRDSNSMAESGLFYQGALSSLGVLLWWGAAVVSAFTFVLLGRAPQPSTTLQGSRAFFLYFAVFTGILTLDDLFMLHEEALPNYLGIPEAVVYACYGILAFGFVRFIPFVFRTNFVLLALAFGFFAFSVLTDFGLLRFLFGMSGGASLVIEDLSKLLGIVSWFGYTLSSSMKATTRAFYAPVLESSAARPQPPRTERLPATTLTPRQLGKSA